MEQESRVEAVVREALLPVSRVVLAVSGGADSMALLEAAVRVAGDRIAAVATFDHGTGRPAQRAAALVARRARALGVPCRVGRSTGGLAKREAAWRAARWSFLRTVARDLNATVVTAHTRDDHAETVFMRALRGAGARGLAGLRATSDVVRPFLGTPRCDLAAYGAAHGVPSVDDPTNRSRAHLRNRVRHDLLPALERARPGLTDELLALADEAAVLRASVERFVATAIRHERRGATLVVARRELAPYDLRELGLLWPALAARLGVVLDRRGTVRLSEFTITGRVGARCQVSGNVHIVRHRDHLVVRRRMAVGAAGSTATIDADTTLGDWHFRRRGDEVPGDLWTALLPIDRRATVRLWQPGDRMRPHGAPQFRRLKGLFRDAGIDADIRRRWPVVLVDDEIVWVPGVRRSSAATVRSGRPVTLYECELRDQ